MEDTVESLRRSIHDCALAGRISDSDLDEFKIRAQRLGIPPSELDIMVREASGADVPFVGGHIRWYHIAMAVMSMVILALLVFINIDFNSDGGRVEKLSPSAMRNMPIAPSDLVHIYSGNCGGAQVLITVRSAQDMGGGMVDMVYDIKCDFVPVATGARCLVNLADNTLDFGHNEAVERKVRLGSGKVSRTAAGKVVINAGDLELVQL